MRNKFELLARSGYAARGVVYVILGAIALSGAAAGSGENASTEGALSTLLAQPFGRVLLAGVAIGLIGHVLWRLAQAFLNADNQESDAKGWAARAGNFASALANGALALAAARMVIASGGGSGGQGEQGLAAWLMQQSYGQVLVGLAGLALIIAGGVQVWRGVSAKYRKHVKLPAEHEDLLHMICVVGLSARGVLLAISGGFFVYAAFTVNPEQAGGLAEGLDWVRQLPFGMFLYSLAAAGLVAFGAYSVIEAWYRRVDAPDTGDVKRAASKVGGMPSRR